MRFVFLILFLAGAAAGVGWLFVAGRFAGAPLGEFRLYQPAAGFRTVDVPLPPGSGSVRMLIDLTLPGPALPDPALSSATLTVARAGQTVFAKPVAFGEAVLRDDNPQTPERAFRAQAGTLAAPEAGTYAFTVSRGEAEIPQVTAIDLILERAAPAYAQFLQPAGFAAMAIGFIGFVLTAFRRNPAKPAEPPKPRWGRDAGEA